MNASTDYGRNLVAFLLYVYIDSLKEDFVQIIQEKSKRNTEQDLSLQQSKSKILKLKCNENPQIISLVNNMKQFLSHT